MEKHHKGLHLIMETAVILSILIMLVHPVQSDSYRSRETDTLHYLRAEVTEIESEYIEESSLDSRKKLGEQHLKLRTETGEEISAANYLTEIHNIYAEKGDRVIICADTPENTEPYYTVYNYDRSGSLTLLAVLFVILLAVTGQRKGIDSCLSIVFTIILVIRVMLPLIYNGFSPATAGLASAAVSAAVTILLINGPSKHSLLAMAATFAGEIAACILFLIFSEQLHITGFQTESAEGLLLIAQNTGMNIRTLLFAGVMISSLGAVMDVAVSVMAAVREVASAAGKAEKIMLFRSAMRMGQDMIGTMSNTLIFAFTGGSLLTMLVFYSYGIQFHQLLSSDYLAVELAQGLCSTAAVILTVPAAAATGAVYYGK